MPKAKRSSKKPADKFWPLMIFVIVFLLTILILIYQYQLISAHRQVTPACPEEAKLCADGSAVGRRGPNCEFAPCPPENKLVSQTIKLYFNNSFLNPNSQDCSLVFPVAREVVANDYVMQSALHELFKGPTEAETAAGYVSWFSSSTQNILQGLGVIDGVAYVNLQDIRELLPNVSASCGSAEFLAEIESTLKQFPGINKVIIALDGQPEVFYEWIQIGCAAENNFCEAAPFQELNPSLEQGSSDKQVKEEETAPETSSVESRNIFIEKLSDCPVGDKFFQEDCACPAPWNIRTGSAEDGFQCVGMPRDNL